MLWNARITKKQGIYLITCIRDDNTEVYYIGSSSVLAERQAEHFRRLNKNKHDNKHLQSAYNMYKDIGKFTYTVLEFTDNLVEREQYYLDKYRAEGKEVFNKAMNVLKSQKGIKRTQEEKDLKSKQLLEFYKSEKGLEARKRLQQTTTELNYKATPKMISLETGIIIDECKSIQNLAAIIDCEPTLVSNYLNNKSRWVKYHVTLEHYLDIKKKVLNSIQNTNTKENEDKFNFTPKFVNIFTGEITLEVNHLGIVAKLLNTSRPNVESYLKGKNIKFADCMTVEHFLDLTLGYSNQYENIKKKIKVKRTQETIDKHKKAVKDFSKSEKGILQQKVMTDAAKQKTCIPTSKLINIKTLDIIDSFPSQSELARYLGVSYAAIQACMRDRTNSIKGYIKYENYLKLQNLNS